jgi:hypothetical protein
MKRLLKVLTIIFLMVIYGCDPKDQETLYYSDHSVKSTCTLVDGRRDGVLIEYYPDGVVCSKQNWKEGKLNGEVLMYYTNGSLGERSFFQDSVKIGVTSYYYETGELLEKQWYDSIGRRIDFERYSKSGTIDYSGSAPIFFLNRDTVQIGDSVILFIKLANIDTSKVVQEAFFITSGFTDEGDLLDTLQYQVLLEHNMSFFKYSVVARSKGLNHIYGRIISEMITDSVNVDMRYSFIQPYFVPK